MKKFDEVVIQKTKAIANTIAAICCTPPKEARNLRVNLGDTFNPVLNCLQQMGRNFGFRDVYLFSSQGQHKMVGRQL